MRAACMVSLLLLLGALPAGAEAPATLVGRLFDAFNRHDPVALEALYAPEAMLRSSDFCGARQGRDVRRTYAALFREFPDIRDEPETVLVQGDRAAVRFRSVARGLDLRLVTFFRFAQGKIIEDDTLFDTGGRPCAP